ncbi:MULTISPECIES: hypothetical protein [unclassified Sphingomonas]|uniref:hypothetical protein n=1 Tax=unclassified Sphingomonas TaxID=196159 RepID=UPI0006F5C43C|nr:MULTISPECIES: hypothetical protein [unclassified Sphingomonas]KQM61832.1 hypothetical protein ASE65_06385 [Sphingomonas sp. Leaf16]KQN13105.1 hypothetical protein ASE81_07400 [Sphingomonas sp. Leaf29]KQN19992.1 hypothetical protein ASE83_07325 [Sphingomonas sp. Leaf32]
MPIVAATLIACIVILRLWPDLPVVRVLAGLLVVPIARRFASLTPGHWLLFLILSAAAGTVVWMGGDMIVVSAVGSPELAGVLMAIDVAAYLDAVLAALAVAGAVRGVSLKLWVARVLPRSRSRRTRRVRVARKAANDDDPAGVAIAA